MKYYKGTRRRKRASNSKISSVVVSQNTSNSVEGNEVSRESTTNSQSSSTKKERTSGKKRPSSSSPLTEKQSTGRTKRTKTRHTTPEEESNKIKQTNTIKHPDSSDDNEPKISSNKKSTTQSTTVRSSTRGSRRNESLRKKVKSSDNIKSNSSSTADKRRDRTLRNVYVTKQKNSKSLKKTKSKSTEPNSPTSDSSETAISVFEDDEEDINQAVRSGQAEAENSFEVLSAGEISSDGVISCSEFLQQQVRILKGEFEIEDCPELAAHLQGTKRQQKNHIPKEIVLKALRKLNFKVEDELLKSLNRQAQRKILKQVDEIRSSYGMTGKKKSNEEEETGQEPEGKIEELKKTVEMSTAELEGLKRLTDMAAEIGSMAEDINTNPLVEEVKLTNVLIQKLTQKVRNEGFTNENQETLTPKGPLSHQEIVEKLFS